MPSSPAKALAAWRERASARPIRSHLIPWLVGLSVLPALTVTLVTVISFWRSQSLSDARLLQDALSHAARRMAQMLDGAARDAGRAAEDPALIEAVQAKQWAACDTVCSRLQEQVDVDAVALYDAEGTLVVGDARGPAGNERAQSPGMLGWVSDDLHRQWLAASAEVEAEAGATAHLVLFTRVGSELCIDLRHRPDVGVAVWPKGAYEPISPPGLRVRPAQLQGAFEHNGEAVSLQLEGDAFLVAARTVTYADGSAPLWVATVSQDRAQSAVLYRATWTNLAVLGSVLLVALGVGAALARRIAAPIENVAGAARSLAQGDLTRRAPVDGPREFRDLAAAFNYMAGALEEQTDQLRATNAELDRQMARIQELNELLRRAARTDSLTQVGTHGYIQERLAEQIGLCLNSARPLSLLMVDVDYFKKVNDTYGHPTGDRVLREVARAICSAVRESDLIGRQGGDEF